MFQPLKVLPCSPFLKFQNNASERLPIHFNYVRDVRNFLSWLSSLDCFYLNCSKYRNRYLPLHPALPPRNLPPVRTSFLYFSFELSCRWPETWSSHDYEPSPTLRNHLPSEGWTAAPSGRSRRRAPPWPLPLSPSTLCPWWQVHHCDALMSNPRGDRALSCYHRGTHYASGASCSTGGKALLELGDPRGGTHHRPLPHSPPPGEPQIFLNTAQTSSNPNTPWGLPPCSHLPMRVPKPTAFTEEMQIYPRML